MIATDRQGISTGTCREYGISVTVHDRLASRENPALENAVQDFIEFLENCSPDIIHCHSQGIALAVISAGNRINIPCAITGDASARSIEGRRRGLRFATLCLATASFEELLNSEIPGADVYYVPNGCRVLPPTQAQQTEASHSPSLIVAAALESRKAIDVLILAMVELRRRLGRACPFLNIYGDGSSRKYLTKMTAVLELNDFVRFHGFELDILEHCPSTDILVMPSRHEVSPLVVLEAMSRGMPIVATDVGEVTKMLPDRRYGRVIPRDSVMALADAIESLLADISGGLFDPDLLIRRHRSIYSIDKFAERTEAAYTQILLNSSATVQKAG
jgi:glycosyltransferase involved in cell wall biosynthesis